MPSARVMPWLFVISSFVGAAGFVRSGAEHSYLALGAGGIAAVGVAWASKASTPGRATARALASAAGIIGASAVVWWLWAGVVVWASTAGDVPLLESFGVRNGPDDGVSQTVLEIPPRTVVAWAGMVLGVALCGVLGSVARRLATDQDARAARTRARRLAVFAPFVVIATAALVHGAYSGAIVAGLGGWWLLWTLRPGAGAPTAPKAAAAPA